MKPLKAIIPFTLFVMLFASLSGQESDSLPKTTLWKIEHPQQKEVSYLFGTIHMQCEKDFVMPNRVTHALAEVDQLVLEIDLSDPNEIKEMQTAMLQSEKV
jgi:uncharacterized protein YbaP (TraB family)